MSAVPQKRWTSDEIELLRVFYPHSFMQALCRVLPGRTPVMIKQKAIRTKTKKTAKCMRMHHEETRLRPEYGRTRVNDDGYVEVLKDSRWQKLGRVIYEQHYGPIPPGHNVTYADGDRKNLSPKNLRLISHRDALEKVSFSGYPKEIREIMLISNKIKKEINERT